MWILSRSYSNFHTIPSILKLYCSGDASFIGLNFHTIPSILKLYHDEYIVIQRELFPYDSVYFKAHEPLAGTLDPA